MNNPLYRKVTNQIIQQIEAGGVLPWQRPWVKTGIGFPRRSNGKFYTGINVLILWLSAFENEFRSEYWMTCAQAHRFGGEIQDNAIPTKIIFSMPFQSRNIEHTYSQSTTSKWVFRKIYVFNVSQINNLPKRFYQKPKIAEIIGNRIPDVDAFVAHTKAKIFETGDRAYYRLDLDTITMPEFYKFHSVLDFYSTELHELIHWTGHESRLDRFKADDADDTKDVRNIMEKRRKEYAIEELIAELGSAFLCAQLGLENKVREDHVQYLNNWLGALKNDTNFLSSAFYFASVASEFLNNFQPKSPKPLKMMHKKVA